MSEQQQQTTDRGSLSYLWHYWINSQIGRAHV